MTNYSRSVLKSNGFHHSENLPVKFVFSSKTVPANIAQKLPSQRCSQPFLIPLFNFSHKRPTFAFTSKSGYTLTFANRIAHSGSQGETQGIPDGAAITTPGAFRTFTNIPGPGIRTANFAVLGSWPGGAPKERREPSEQRCAHAHRCSEGVAALLDCVILFLLSELWLVCPVLRAFPRVRDEGGITTPGVLCVLPKRRTSACQSGSFVVFGCCRAALPARSLFLLIRRYPCRQFQ